MATLKDFRDERLRKLQEIRDLGVNPYPAGTNRTHNVADVTNNFDELEDKEVTISGRIMSIRKFGKLAFIVVRDMSGSVQIFIRKGEDDEPSAPDRSNSELTMPGEIALLDTGDFVECRGKVVKTKTGEVSVTCENFRLLTKALRPMPSKQEGFTDKEQRLRRRYVDMNVNTDVRNRFERRSKFWQAARDFLNKDGFLEVNIPVLEHTTGGADATPFVTHMDALDQDFYLRISHELPLKRLTGAGFEKVYDLGPRFRNENYSDEHLPEHVAIEWYWAYADWKDGMKQTEDMFRYIMQETFGKLQFNVNGHEVDLSQDWEKWDYAEVIKKHYDIDVFDCTIQQIQKALAEHKIEVEKTDSIPRGIDKLWKKVRATVTGPVWLINTPKFISPLSKASVNDPRTTERAQAVIAGTELVNLFSELNDAVDQLDRFMEQQSMRDGGDDEAMMLDIDYVEMLEYGMPPTCGFGFSERVFWVFEGVTAREGVPFPQLRHEIDEVTKSVYPQLYSAEAIRNQSTQRDQDFSRRIITVVRKDLEPWRVANAVAHMEAIIGNKTPSKQLVTSESFVDKNGDTIPRNTQYPIIIMKGSEKSLHKLHRKITAENLTHHVFIKEMQDTSNDQEIVDAMSTKTFDDTEFYGVSFLASNDVAKSLTKDFQIWK